ncbi:peptidase inhibitor family I36 protein [Streptomyces sp. WG7]|uniref:peptidase inhibitor family I36 protein n=1 Tax=Streptomyces sp. WG7 TaxID=3417650 RepID=UPI003CF635C7
MLKKRRIGAALGALASLGGLVVTAAPAASAATPAPVCPRPYPNVAPLCLYDGADFTGLLDNYPANSGNLPDWKDDKISSIINDSDYHFMFFADDHYRELVVELAPGERWVAPPEWDNTITQIFGY